MDKKDMLTIASAVITAASGVITIALAYKEYKTTMNNHERIQQLEDTVKWMVQLDLQKESDQSKN